MEFLDLPLVMIENIFSYFSHDEIAKNRLVCRTFNEICSRMLNRGFLMIERRHAMALKTVKAQLPRRESERRHHPLSRHCDILTSIETRISMLSMTYSKYIDTGMCCFIPGKVIDEIKRVLTILDTSATPPRAHEVLQELRDISSMAIEHFDDKISPAFRKNLQEGIAQVAPKPGNGLIAMRQEILTLQRRSTLNSNLSLCLGLQYKKFQNRLDRLARYRKLAMKQVVIIRQLTKKQREQDLAIAELKKRIEECDIKYRELTHTNQAGGKAIAAAASVGVVEASPSQELRHFSSQIKLDLSVLPIGTSKLNNKLTTNIKPRNPMIKLPSLLNDDDASKARDAPTAHEARPGTAAKRAARKRKTSTATNSGLAHKMRHLANMSDGDLNDQASLRNISSYFTDEDIKRFLEMHETDRRRKRPPPCETVLSNEIKRLAGPADATQRSGKRQRLD